MKLKTLLLTNSAILEYSQIKIAVLNFAFHKFKTSDKNFNKQSVLVVILLLFSTIFYAQTVTIPDANLKNTLINNLSINTNADTEIQVTEANAYTGYLNLFNKNIGDATGIEAFVNIKGLNLSSNNLYTVDVSKNIMLASLALNRNNIAELDVTKNTKLVSLGVGENDLKSIDISKNTFLRTFYCNDNALRSLDFSKNILLEFLIVSYNEISVLDVSNLLYLDTLVCTKNSLSSLDLSTNVNLTYLLCDQNQISHLDVSGNDKLEIFACGYNDMTTLLLPSLSTSLRSFSCNNNLLESIDVSPFPNLEVLTCSSNPTPSLDLSEISSLKSITCGNNNVITKLDVSTQKGLTYLSAGFSRKLSSVNVNNGNNTNMTTLYLRNIAPTAKICVDDVAYASEQFTDIDSSTIFTNQCSVVYIPDVNLKQALVDNLVINTNADTEIQVTEAEAYTGNLNLFSKNIIDMTGIEAFVNIKALFVEDNNISSIDLSSNTLLKYLSISKNQLDSLDVSNLLNLTNLVCTKNSLSSLDLSTNVNLTYLLCDQNQLSSLDVSGNDKLETFICGYNDMTTLILPSSSTSLKRFACNNNLLESIDVSPFPNLEVLTCSSNPVPSLDLSEISSLKSITCGNNNVITELDVSTQKGLTHLSAGFSRKLSSVNVKNGNNINMTTLYLRSIAPTAKICVDDVAYANEQFTNIDSSTVFTNQCSIVYIPDVNFKNRILSHDPIIDSNADGEIQVSEAEKFDGFLKVGNYNFSYENLIEDLTGIETFVNLKGFDCSEQSVNQDLDFSANTSLIEINIGGNEISNINLSKNLSLKILDVSGNYYLSNLDVRANINLEELNIRHTEFSAIDISKNTVLVKLEAFASDLTSLDLSTNIELKDLSLGGSKITTIDLSANTKLEKLEWQSDLYNEIDLSSNINLKSFAGYGTNFSDFNISNNVNLESLYIGNNKNLKTLDVTNNVKLKILSIANTELSILNLLNNVALERLDIANAKFTELDLSNNKMLQSLNVKNNKFTNLDLSCVNSLTSLDVSNNAFLESLNIKNGNTSNIFYFVATGAPLLQFICVDNVDVATVKFKRIDSSITTFTQNCNGNTCNSNRIKADVVYNDKFIANNSYKIFPMPFNDELIVNGITNEKIFQVDFYSITGKHFSVGYITENNKQVFNTSQLPSGVYFLKFRTDKGFLVRKIIKQ
ncbi:T9SS type A sorting domain-containing protein [Aquimarina aggregata]|uniref:T9SS type A sorting domain-containing protein n=1 Tax=Aquimarina aggregata TaxID=1642818 RepID=UPI0024929370|nr:T9SS type A sorting domain-containing protein [Aquimarina aggregata]